MKKILLTLFAVFAIGFANAQIKTNAGTFTKPVKGDYTAEVNFTPNLDGNDMFDESESADRTDVTGIKLRKFVSDKKAYRLTLELNIDNFTDKVTDYKERDTYFGVAYGVEKHFKGAERLSTYWGYEGTFELDLYKEKYSNGNTWKSTGVGVGAATFVGADYYILPNVFLGVEASYNLTYWNYKNDDGDKENNFESNDDVNALLRLGWKF